MKILFDHPSPFLLAHGGFQIQIEETKRSLENLGLTVEYLRWWDAEQRGDIIHFFGRPAGAYIDFAHSKKIPVIIAEVLTGLGSRSRSAIALQRLWIGLSRRYVPRELTAKLAWDAYAKADRVIALTAWEAELMHRVFEAPPERVVVIPNGVASEFLAAGESNIERGDRLVCVATITERKRLLELAQAAVHGQTPLWVVGNAFSEADAYAQQFFALAQRYPKMIRYEGPVQDRNQLAEIYRQARGFVLLSTMESLSLSALEAGACKCPLLLSDLPWARTVFKDKAMYCPIAGREQTTKFLRQFYEVAPRFPVPPKPLAWMEVAERLKGIYEELLSASR